MSKRKTPKYDPRRKQMSVADLIAALATYPPDLRVVVDGSEEGFDDIVMRRSVAAPNFDAPHWAGQWRQIYDHNVMPGDAFDVLVISRTDWPDWSKPDA